MNIPFRVHLNLLFILLYPLGYVLYYYLYFCTLMGINMNTSIATFIKVKRKQLKLTQPELAEKAGVGIRFVRELEQGKQSVRLDKVNQLLDLFGSELGVIQKTD
jgi:y4mF family transcriptional regulator